MFGSMFGSVFEPFLNCRSSYSSQCKDMNGDRVSKKRVNLLLWKQYHVMQSELVKGVICSCPAVGAEVRVVTERMKAVVITLTEVIVGF